jgi:uncharacterized membrane protein
VIKSTEPQGRALSDELRNSHDPMVERRRGVVALATVAAGAMGVIALYQMGITRHLPEPPIPRLDADTVDASAEAYQMLRMPDAALGLLSYSTTIALASLGGADRGKRHPWIPLALAAKVGVDAVQAARLSVDQWRKHRAFCSWCLLAAAATFAAVPLVIPEARAVTRRNRHSVGLRRNATDLLT